MDPQPLQRHARPRPHARAQRSGLLVGQQVVAQAVRPPRGRLDVAKHGRRDVGLQPLAQRDEGDVDEGHVNSGQVLPSQPSLLIAS
eukprot:104084-Prymnesium_polylepis.1